MTQADNVIAAGPALPGPAGAVADFPFYNGRPAALSGRDWMIVLGAVAAAFAVLTADLALFTTPLGQFIPAILFAVLPLVALAAVCPRHWTALFRPLRWRDPLLMIGFALLNVVVSSAVGLLVYLTVGASSNVAIGEVGRLDATAQALFFLKTIPQLLSEEILTLLPFLALLWGLVGWLGVGRQPAIVLAWLASALLFGAAHLPTYHWNWVQCLVVIGVARLVLTLPYLLTRNVLVSAGAHILNDWLLFAVVLLGPALLKS